MKENIILIGPIGVGKTTISNILSKDTDIKVCHNERLKDFAVYTKGKTPQEIANEISKRKSKLQNNFRKY